MALRYPKLFKPFNIGGVEIKNRICMSPMGVPGWLDANSCYTEEAIAYYEERAKGGVGLIFTSGTTPNTKIEPDDSPYAEPYPFITQTRKLAERLHLYGTKLFVQIYLGTGRVCDPRPDAISASENPNRWDPELITRALTTEEIYELINAAIDAAVICNEAGADGVDINGAYGSYLGDQFATDIFNNRTDEFGGSMEGQLKLLTDIVKGINGACGAKFGVTCRFSTKHYMKALGQAGMPGEEYAEVGRDVAQSVEMGKMLEVAGYDALLIGNGAYDSFHWLYTPMYHKEGLWLDDIAPLTKEVNIPVIAAGKILQPEMANDVISNGIADAVAIGRGLIADPYWADKTKLGKPEDIRPCIGCNAGCIARIFAGLPLQCAVNPDLFYENSTKGKLVPTTEPKKIAIIGGGVAGMECACIAAKRGHSVTIYEKSHVLGGRMVAASVPYFKVADRRLLAWFEKELRESGVKVELGKALALEEIETLDVDEIVVATGTTPFIPPIPGIDHESVVQVTDVLSGKEVGDRIVLIGGGQVGLEVAVWLKKQGKDVIVAEALPELMAGAPEAIAVPNKLCFLMNSNITILKCLREQRLKSMTERRFM